MRQIENQRPGHDHPDLPPQGKAQQSNRKGRAKKGCYDGNRIFATSVASVYPHYVAKAEKKGRTAAEVDLILCWLTGHSAESLGEALAQRVTFEDFFAAAPGMNPHRTLISGTVCGVRVEALEDGTMREIRYLDKLVDELAKGRPMEKILRRTAE